jgi:hypothetical protein
VIAVATSDELVIGLVLGFLIGVLAAPALRSWLGWREWVHASREADRDAREADLITEMLELMDPDDASSSPPPAQEEDTGSRLQPRTLQDRWQPQP